MAVSSQRYPEENERWPRKGQAMSEEEYHELERLSPDRKYEYIDGMAYLMSGGSVAHDLISFNMRSLLAQALRGSSCRAFGVDVQVLVGTKKNGKPQFYYPDTTVSCAAEDRRVDNTLIEAARVVVEVLSPSTEAADRGRKFKNYQRYPSIQEIVLVSQFAEHVEVWRRDALETARWHCCHYDAGEAIELVSINVTIPIAALYDGIDFIEPEDE